MGLGGLWTCSHLAQECLLRGFGRLGGVPRRVLGDCGSVLRGLTEGQPILFPEDEVQSRVSSSPVLNWRVSLVGPTGRSRTLSRPASVPGQ